MRGFSLFFLSVFLISPTHAATEIVEGSYHSVWDQDGHRSFFDVPARIDISQSETAVVQFEVTVTQGTKETRRTLVSAQDVQTARQLLERGHVSVELPNGGLLNGFAHSIAILNENGTVQVGLEILHSDLIPTSQMARYAPLIRSVHPMSRVRSAIVGDPLDVPLLEQRLLLGSVIKTWNATPVVVLGKRTAIPGGPSYFVMEKRDLVDPAIRMARIYLVPMDWLRVAQDPDEYQRLLDATLVSNAWKRDPNYTAFRHQGLTPWTHAVFYFDEDPTSFVTETERFERRATQLLKWWNGMPKPDAGRSLVVKSRNCADYLYLPDGE